MLILQHLQKLRAICSLTQAPRNSLYIHLKDHNKSINPE